MSFCGNPLLWPLLGAKRTCLFICLLLTQSGHQALSLVDIDQRETLPTHVDVSIGTFVPNHRGVLMNITRRHAMAAGFGTAFSALGLSARAEFNGPVLSVAEGGEEFWLATDAYIYGYPLVTMEMTRRVMTNVPALQGTRGPMGQFIKLRQYPDATFRDVTAPNADTLYTSAWLDVGKEPWVLSIPDMKDRYFLVPLLDGWTNVFHVPGKRTTGTQAQTYAIT